MSLPPIFEKYLFYWISLLCLLPFIVYYYRKTFHKDMVDIFWFIYEDGERKFDFGFLKKIITRLAQIFITFFTFFNVIYFVLQGVWYDNGSFEASKSFVIIGAITYIIDTIEKSSDTLHEQKRKKIKIKKEDTTQERQEEKPH